MADDDTMPDLIYSRPHSVRATYTSTMADQQAMPGASPIDLLLQRLSTEYRFSISTGSASRPTSRRNSEKPINAFRGLPRQDKFIRNGVVVSSTDTKLPPGGTDCGICLEACVVGCYTVQYGYGDGSIVARRREQEEDSDTVVYLNPCGHFYHRGCILRWFTSSRPERETCPNCRRVLFVANPLTAAQIASLDTEEIQLHDFGWRPMGPFRELEPFEELVNWEHWMIDELARMAVLCEMDHARVYNRPHRWIQVCQQMRDQLLASTEDPVRTVFLPHRDTFLNLLCLGQLRFRIMAHREIMEGPDSAPFREFAMWGQRIEERLGMERLMELWAEYFMRGLFNTPYVRMQVVPQSWSQSLRDAAARNVVVSEERSRALSLLIAEREAMFRRDDGIRGRLRRVGRRIAFAGSRIRNVALAAIGLRDRRETTRRT